MVTKGLLLRGGSWRAGGGRKEEAGGGGGGGDRKGGGDGGEDHGICSDPLPRNISSVTELSKIVKFWPKLSNFRII